MVDINNITKEELLKLLKKAGIIPETLDTTRYIGWSIKDVQSEYVNPDIDDSEALKLLEEAISEHDATIGITWATLRYYANVRLIDNLEL